MTKILDTAKAMLGGKKEKWDGTPLTGFVTDKENRPPRQCSNCMYYQESEPHDGCNNKHVMADPKARAKAAANGLGRANQDGTVPVKDLWCCNFMKNKKLEK